MYKLCVYVILLYYKNFENSFKKFLYMQTTPDDGLWKIRKRLGQFW